MRSQRGTYSAGDLIKVVFCEEPCVVLEVVNSDVVARMPGANLLYKVMSPMGVGYAFEHEITGQADANT